MHSQYSRLSQETPPVRLWTNVILAANVIAFMAHIVIGTENRLILWGAKVNNLIAKGQIWRLLTPAFLHVNLIHLLLNCYSVHSLGPHLESLGGSKRFLVVFAVAAVTTSCLSFLMCKSPAVGASGAICGLIGALAVYSFRHRKLLNKAQENLGRISRTVAFNMVLGLMSHEVDNWGHLGGFVGGAFVSWLIGPALRAVCKGTKVVLEDHPPAIQLWRCWLRWLPRLSLRRPSNNNQY
ncbi:RHOMBOID-like protein 10, chloroplastic [Selaginella moellendorffii]|uniref:RHOMBOID-like protein 10, chloroplastic n=1 Tax=Selaginella moellendorffii TaxID=88036 RepID=UPI000D1C64B8|nr:RHOMBOID-like protein 10, chloroplastic [Selaginella moellendorffii]|eukprot:XP_024522921.1 RHOMBOID-like protein 10, chloroplastic [Selaginella moellendorffii]